MRRFFSTRRDDDRGVVLILIALAMVAILTMVAIVIDLGQARASRREDQAVADLSALAAGFYLSGRGQTIAISNPQKACQAAVEAAIANQPAFTPSVSSATACASFPTSASVCVDANPMSPIQTVLTSNGYTLTIRYPIPASELSDPRFSGAGANDGTDQCQRMRTTFAQTNATFFARAIGVNSVSTSGTSVVRGGASSTGEGVAALLSLERVGCAALQNSGQAAIRVANPTGPGADGTQPGVIQADSAGQMTGCTTNENAGGYVVYGTALPGGNGPSIVVCSADAAVTCPNNSSVPGVIGLYSLGLTPPGRGAAVYPGGLSVAPTPVGAPTSRQAADTKYNSSTNGNQISNLHNTAYPLTNNFSAASPPSGFTTVLSGNQECNGNVDPVKAAAATKVFVDCPTFSADANIFPLATDFVVKGNIAIANNKVLSLPSVRNFFVRGCSVGVCNGSNTFAIQVAGMLLVDTGETTLPSSFANGTACKVKNPNTNWTQIATFGGSFDVTGQARMCQTFVYMGTNSSSYVRQTVTANNSGPENYPAIAQCSPTLPCPKDGVNTISPFTMTSGGAAADWTAPNQISGKPTKDDYLTYPFEDLALWNETSSINVSFKGQGNNVTQGVFFLPNASALFQGLGTNPIELNAQYFIRKLNLQGQGLITLKPNPNDSITTPIPGIYTLIR